MENKQQTSNEYGISQELLVLSMLTNYGVISIPYGNSGRYDCILDIKGTLYKIQIKSLNIIDGNKIVVPMSNSRMCADGNVKKQYTPDEVDYIAINYNNNVYLFPAGIAMRSYTVSIDPPKTYNQHYLEDYRIDKILNIKLKTWVDLKNEIRENNNNNNTKNKTFSCIDCGAPVSKNNCRCTSCAAIAARITERPNRDELKNLIRKIPFTTIGKQFEVTDNTIRKWCKAYNLPYRVKEINQFSDEQWEEI